jgi:hypothetical protein
VAEFDRPESAQARADAPTAVHDSGFKIWGRRAGYALLTLAVLMPWPLIAWGRAQRSSSAPAVLEEVWLQPNGRITIGAFSFSVDGRVYRGQDERTRTPRRGSRTWSADELEGMHVCFDSARPGEDFALTPARYRCGDPDFITTDGGW